MQDVGFAIIVITILLCIAITGVVKANDRQYRDEP